MSNLKIHIKSPRKYLKKNIYHLLGEIEINDFQEEFDMPLEWWSKEDYERQWQQGLGRIKNHSKSCVVTRIKDPSKGPFIDWWLLYKEEDKIYIRNEVLFGEEYENRIGSAEFTTQNCYDFIPPRGPKILENGMQVSEWVVEIEEVEL